jgi:hypothetical protein
MTGKSRGHTRVVLGAGPRNKEVPLDFGGCGLADFGNLLKVAKIGCPLLRQARKKTRSFFGQKSYRICSNGFSS